MTSAMKYYEEIDDNSFSIALLVLIFRLEHRFRIFFS